MRIRDVNVDDVAAGRNWRLQEDGDVSPDMVEWEIEECATFRSTDTVVYSALVAFTSGEVRPLLLIREVGTPEWWGDTCEYVAGAWRELGPADPWEGQEFVASPLAADPSFMGAYSHHAQRAGFRRWQGGLPRTAGRGMPPATEE